MAHSYQDLFYHFVWTPKYRTDLITKQIKSILLPFLKNKALSLGCRVFALNCIEDHVHMLLYIPARLSVAYVINIQKGASSHEIKEISPEFSWQIGYGVTTLRRSDLKPILKSIKNKSRIGIRSTNVNSLPLDAGGGLILLKQNSANVSNNCGKKLI